jgi:polyisoprenoid-binding protein YceI
MTASAAASPSSSGALALAPGHWTLDAAHSGIHFSVRHLGLTNVRGRFDRFEATLDVGESLDDVAVTASIDMSSVDTNNSDRDAHLRSTDFFGTDVHPTMTFRSSGISGEGDEYELTGDLTVNGITHPVTLDVEFHGTEQFPADQSTHTGFSATGEIRRSEFDIDFGIVAGEKILLSDKVKIELDLQFVAPAG